MNHTLLLILITLIPTLELRASIPYGILISGMPLWWVITICIITNIILGPMIYFILDKLMFILLKIGWVERIYNWSVIRTREKIQKPIDKYGDMGIALFIGIPLPGTGSYTGALGAYLMGLGYKKFIIANIIGVLIAGSVVTTVVLSGVETFNFLIKVIRLG